MSDTTIGIKINAREGKKVERYPLTLDQLRPGQFAECDNGTIVLTVDASDQSATLRGIKAYNLLTGIGFYHSAPTSRFRLLDMKTITLNTDSNAKVVSS